MDYEKKYKEAQKWIESIYSELSHEQQMEAEAFFPELKESEDEKMMHQLHSWMKEFGGAEEYTEKVYTWLKSLLEKQGEQKSIDKEYTFKSIPRLLDMIEPTDRAKSYCKKLIDSLQTEGYSIDAKIVGECLKQMNGEKVAMAVMDIEKQGEQKPADKVEPKFKIGDWVIDKQDIVHQIANVIENVTNHTYGYDIVGGGYFNDNTEGVRLWTINDAKDGDVLDANGAPFIYKRHDEDYVYFYCGVNLGDAFIEANGIDTWNSSNKVYPATKEQRDLLFQKMEEAGYTWNADKKQLKKIEQKPAEEYSFNIESELFHQLTKEQQELWKKEIEQAYNAGVEASDEWSEEDEKYIKDLTDYFIGGMSLKHTEENIIAWIKSLGHQQKQEWSEEDEEYLRRAINAVKNTYPMTANWLKSLKERYTWKPSDAQMGALHDLNLTGNISYEGQGQVLIELYNDLKKLTE